MVITTPSLSVLERPASSIPLEIERATKKVWNKSSDVNPPGDITMEGLVSGKESFKDKLMANVEHKTGDANVDLENDNLEILDGGISV